MALEHRVVVITGASGGLGQVVTRQFAEQGARLALLGRSTGRLETLVRQLGLSEDRYLLSAVDLSDPKGARASAAEVIEKFGRAEILLHLVGGYVGGKSVVEAEAEELSGMLRQHVWTTFHLLQAFVPHIVANRWGRVVAVSHRDALNPPGNNSPYVVAKAGQEIFALSLAQELRGTGVTANVILVRSIDVTHERDRNPSPESATKTTPEEIAAAMLYLCSDEAGTVNGARIPLYGGP